MADPTLKALERRWRHLVVAAVNRMMPTPRGRPDWDARPWRVLFLRHDRIGDMIASTATLRAIATAHPNVTLDVLASPANAPVLRGLPGLGDTVVFDRRRPRAFPGAARRLGTAGYDCVVDCMVTAPSATTAMLMAATRAPWRVGIAGRGNDGAYTLAVPPGPGTHMADRIAALAAAFGVSLAPGAARPVLVLADDERARAEAVWRAAGGGRARRLLVNISAGAAARRWPPERWVALLGVARGRRPDMVTVITGDPADGDAIASIARGVGAHVALGTLRDAFALVASTDFLLSPDTSLVQAASAFARPSVVLGPTRMAPLWGPYGGLGRFVTVDGPLSQLGTEPVIAALDAVLSGATDGAVGGPGGDAGRPPTVA